MAEDGIVGEYNGSQAREVLYTWEQWQELKAGQDGELVGVTTDEDEEDE
jgi:S-DNA-T family DNA segregation ATPase FtsK/SpoIIIE